MRLLAALASACLLFASGTAVAKYTPPLLSQCVFDAQVVVVGHVETLREKDYVFRVEEWLAGTPKSETLTVRRFQDWTCGSRLPKYAVGQRFVAFLQTFDGALESMGGGCEGDVLLDDGVAVMTARPGGIGSRSSPVPARRFVEAVRTLRTGYRDIGTPGFAAAWRALLANPEPIVVATAIERLGAGFEADVNPEPGSAFADALTDVVESPDRDLRIYAARRIGACLGPAERWSAARRLAVLAQSSKPEFRPAAALARLSLRPGDASSHIAMLRVLSDESVPLEDRVAAADAVIHAPFAALEPDSLRRVDPVARQAIGSVDDSDLLLRLCAYLDRLHKRSEHPNPTDAEDGRTKWLALLPDVPAAAADAEPDDPPPPSSPYLSAEERAVFVPRDAAERPRIARIVRAVRRARNAERAHDDAAALDAYRDALSATNSIGEPTRRVLLELGIDVEEVGRAGRALDAERR